MNKYQEAVAVERAEGFDRAEAESVIEDWLLEKGAGSREFFASRQPGVIAFERLGYEDRQGADLQGLAADLLDKTGVHVACIANCDWSFDEDSDLEATYVAFRIPSLDEGYDTPYRNEIVPTDDEELAATPLTAPVI